MAHRVLYRQAGVKAFAYTIIGLNSAVFLAWKYADNTIPVEITSKSGPNLSKDRVRTNLWKNFTLKPEDPQRGRWWTSLTSTFSHHSFGHFIFNMAAFHSFSTYVALAPTMTPLRFAGLCLGSGLAGSQGYLYHQNTRPNGRSTAALGASGMVMGVASMCALMAPWARWQIMFIPVGIPAWVLMGAYFAWDAYYLDATDSVIGHAGHIGGAVFGAAYYLLFFRRIGVGRMLFRR